LFKVVAADHVRMNPKHTCVTCFVTRSDFERNRKMPCLALLHTACINCVRGDLHPQCHAGLS